VQRWDEDTEFRRVMTEQGYDPQIIQALEEAAHEKPEKNSRLWWERKWAERSIYSVWSQSGWIHPIRANPDRAEEIYENMSLYAPDKTPNVRPGKPVAGTASSSSGDPRPQEWVGQAWQSKDEERANKGWRSHGWDEADVGDQQGWHNADWRQWWQSPEEDHRNTGYHRSGDWLESRSSPSSSEQYAWRGTSWK